MSAMTTEAIIGAWVQQGIAPDTAREVASCFDDRMKSSILPLYRSATRIA